MPNDTSDQSGALGVLEEEVGVQEVQSQAHNAAENVNTTDTNRSYSRDDERESHEGPSVPQQRSRGQSFTRLSGRVRAMRSGVGNLDRTTSTSGNRLAPHGTDHLEAVANHPEDSSLDNGNLAGRTRRSKTISARNNLPNPGSLRRSETRAREEEWMRTVASPIERDPQQTTQEGNTDKLGHLPNFQRNNFGGEFGSLRRRGTALTTGRPRGDSILSDGSIVAPARVGEAGPDPNFSLAGPENPIAASLPFVERGYAVLNPAYDQPFNQRPVWGLAKPLPRVVRPGMVPSASELNINQDSDLEAGEAPRKASRAWDLALAAAKARSSKLNQQASNEANEGDAQPGPGHQGTEPTDHTGLTPPIPEHPDEHSLEPFPDTTPSPTEVYDEHDLLPDDMIGLAYSDEIHNHHTEWSVIRTKYREPLAELLAVIVQLTLGFCADLAVTASTSSAGDTTAWAWGLATMVGIYIAGGISGAHLNPAISIMLWIYRGFPLRKVPSYMLAQILGGFIAALIAFGIYKDAIINYGGSDLATGGTAADIVTYPRYEYISIPTAFFNEFVGTAFLAVAVMALGDDSNAPPGAGMSAFILGLVVTVNSMAFGHNTGAACNPSRDFGPRLALLALGYGSGLFKDPYWFYGPWVACICGAIFGAALYDICIFTGGESPINYPSFKLKRAAKKWRGRMRERAVRRMPRRFGTRKWRRREDGYGKTAEMHDK